MIAWTLWCTVRFTTLHDKLPRAGRGCVYLSAWPQEAWVCFLVGPTGVLPNVTMLASWKSHQAQYQIVRRRYRIDGDNPRFERRRLSRYNRGTVPTLPCLQFPLLCPILLFLMYLCSRLPLYRTSCWRKKLISAERPLSPATRDPEKATRDRPNRGGITHVIAESGADGSTAAPSSRSLSSMLPLYKHRLCSIRAMELMKEPVARPNLFISIHHHPSLFLTSPTPGAAVAAQGSLPIPIAHEEGDDIFKSSAASEYQCLSMRCFAAHCNTTSPYLPIERAAIRDDVTATQEGRAIVS